MEKKVRFKHLSGDLKTLVVLGWIFVALNVVTFFIGFVMALAGILTL